MHGWLLSLQSISSCTVRSCFSCLRERQPEARLCAFMGRSLRGQLCPSSNMDDSLPSYAYEALLTPDTVRILVLQPAASLSDPIECSIIHRRRPDILCDPDNKEHYDAISYAWGEPDFCRQIFLKNRSSTLNISPNVDIMLRHLRKSSADAWC